MSSSSSPTRRHVLLFNQKTRLRVQQEVHVEQEDMSSCPTRRHVKKTCLLVQQEDMSSVEKEDMSSVEQEDMSSCSRRGHAFLFHKKTCLLVRQGVVDQEDASSKIMLYGHRIQSSYMMSISCVCPLFLYYSWRKAYVKLKQKKTSHDQLHNQCIGRPCGCLPAALSFRRPLPFVIFQRARPVCLRPRLCTGWAHVQSWKHWCNVILTDHAVLIGAYSNNVHTQRFKHNVHKLIQCDPN